MAHSRSTVATDTPNYDSELLNLKTREQAEAGAGGSTGEKLRERDPVYEQAVEVVIREQRGSTSLLQRALGIGYGKAGEAVATRIDRRDRSAPDHAGELGGRAVGEVQIGGHAGDSPCQAAASEGP